LRPNPRQNEFVVFRAGRRVNRRNALEQNVGNSKVQVAVVQEPWDPFGTIGQALWIGGGQWAGKSTVARILAARHRVTAYHYDYHDGRAHADRRTAQRVRRGEPPTTSNPEIDWVLRSPEKMAADALAGFTERFEWVLDDLRALVSGHPIIAEGWGLRPELVVPLLDSPDRMVIMVPSEEFRLRQLRQLPRAATLPFALSDPARAQRNRIARDVLVAADVVQSARHHGIRVILVDGSLDASGVADLVERHFVRFLQPGEHRTASQGPQICRGAVNRDDTEARQIKSTDDCSHLRTASSLTHAPS
jgi:hypothetical protein